MNDLDHLEAEGIYIFREAFNRLDNIAMLWSLGKDSNVMLWLARKAFSVMCRFRSFMSTRNASFQR